MGDSHTTMRLSFSSDHHVSDTMFVDDQNHQVYATTSNMLVRRTEILKFGPGTSNPSNLALVHFHNWSPDTITMGGQDLAAKEYLSKPSWFSSRRVFTAANGTTYEWEGCGFDTWRLSLLNGPEVGRSHSRSLGLMGPSKPPPYLEFSDDPRVLGSLDELIATYVY